MLYSLSYFSLLRKCKAIEIFILKKIESDRDEAIGRAYVLRLVVQIFTLDKQVWISLELGD